MTRMFVGLLRTLWLPQQERPTELGLSKNYVRLSWWSCGWESAFQCRGCGFVSLWGTKIPHAMGQLSHGLQLQKAHMLQWRPSRAKIQKKKEKVWPICICLWHFTILIGNWWQKIGQWRQERYKILDQIKGHWLVKGFVEYSTVAPKGFLCWKCPTVLTH